MPRTALYRHYDAEGRLLYVGVTDCLTERDKQHASKSVWHKDVARTDTEWCLSRDHAFALERVAIEYERPLHNVQFSAEAADRRAAQAGDFGPIFRIWSQMSDLAADLKVPYMTAVSWFQRGSFPAKRDLDLIEAARNRGAVITLEQIAAARKSKRSSC